MNWPLWKMFWLVLALILFIIGALLVFGTFGTVKLDTGVGVGLLGLGAFAAAHFAPVP